ncbi:MAG: helix-turn-helix domain-containing protein [Rhodococcus sp. (in: high G+C Gram-positive bacteria)]|uniref:PucR family transcriptional regulator n=1 Tax=Rhodococcus sp. EPR-157 TaxID=1813677 RepID=UPI000AACA140|nr:PucR family transcriptional regulator [Rhodococcus sp. EPR-157]
MASSREKVVAHIEQDLASVVAAAVDAIRTSIPAYRDLHGPQLADVEAIAFWSLRRLITLWSDGSGVVDHRDQSRFRAIGAARASDGRPLTDVLRAYRVASSVFLRHVGGVYLDDLDPSDVVELSVTVLEAVDAISEEITEAYTTAREQLTSNRNQAQATLLDDLVVGRRTSPGALADRSRELGIELPAHPHLLIAQTSGSQITDKTVDALLTALGITRLSRPSHLCTRREQRAILLLPNTVTLEKVDDACRTLLLHGCLVERRPLGEVSASYRVASDALDTAPAHAFHGRSVLDEGDAQLLALLTARPTADTTAVVRAVLGPLTEAANGHILDGVSAFISTGTATAAASELRLHPQTLRYRLRRARELTGRDPRHAWHRLALDTALQLRQLAST